jgi:hypothetical protein
MRHFLRLLVVTTMVMPIGIGAAQHMASADPGTTCSSISGSSSISPGFQKLDPAGPAHYTANDHENDVGTLEKNQTITSSGTISGCSGGGVTGGTFTNSVINTHDPSDCNDLLNVGDTKDTTIESVPTGTITIHWNTGATSTGNVKLKPTSSATQLKVVTKFTSGLFSVGEPTSAPGKGKVNVAFSPSPSTGCTSTNLTGATFTNSGTGTTLVIDPS